MNELFKQGMSSAWLVPARTIRARAERFGNCVRRLWADTSAVTAIEFAIVALPFFLMITGTVAMGLWYFYTASVDQGIYKGVRAIMTGQFQATANATSMSSGTFTKTFVCPNMPAFIPCSATNPVLNVTAVSDFTQLVKQTPVPPPPATTLYYQDTLLPLTPNFCSPQQGDVVYVQAQYKMPNIFGMFGLFNNTMYSGATVQVEQFANGTSVNTNC